MTDIEYVPCKNMVTATKNQMWFGSDYNMNIYRGCSHGCIYCDSRSECYHDDSFFKVKVKEDALLKIERDLKQKQKKGIVGTGSMSDPYNPIEKQLELTRGALKLLDNYGFGVAIATKSDLVRRDIDILKQIATHSPVIVKVTITTANDELGKLLEPNVASASERFAVLRELSDAGIFCGILLMPVLPFITDNVDNIENIVRKAKENEVKFIYPAFGVTLRDRQRTYYYEKLDELFPGKKELYRHNYGNQYSCSALEAKTLSQHFTLVAQECGILYNMPAIIAAYKVIYETEQLSLF